jgi:hypothetical protein
MVIGHALISQVVLFSSKFEDKELIRNPKPEFLLTNRSSNIYEKSLSKTYAKKDKLYTIKYTKNLS